MLKKTYSPSLRFCTQCQCKLIHSFNWSPFEGWIIHSNYHLFEVLNICDRLVRKRNRTYSVCFICSILRVKCEKRSNVHPLNMKLCYICVYGITYSKILLNSKWSRLNLISHCFTDGFRRAPEINNNKNLVTKGWQVERKGAFTTNKEQRK